ncbi:MAG: hypothetical protein RIT81_15765 [Deltaproteobacteria bacterium]
MPSFLHEALIELFRADTSLAIDLCRRSLGAALPDFDGVRVAEATMNELAPAEYAADLVLMLEHHGAAVLAIVVEVQLRIDARKRWTWPVYGVNARARLRCPVLVLVVAPDPRVAAWAARSIALGGRSVFQTEVLSPHAIPAVEAGREALTHPELAVLSAVAHGNEPDGLKAVAAAFSGIARLELPEKRLYLALIDQALSVERRREVTEMGLFELMEEYDRVYGPRDRKLREQAIAEGRALGLKLGEAEGRVAGREEGREEGRHQGLRAGRATAILQVLSHRGVEVDETTRARVLAVEDEAELDRLLAASLSVDRADALFDD